MGWYSAITNFAAEQITGQDRSDDPGQRSARHEPALFNGPEHAPEPEHRTYQGVAPLLAMPSRMEPDAVDRVYTAFDVSQPVGQPDDLRGRDREVRALLSGVLHRRNPGVVSGPRGSGKTSLVRVFGQCADREGVVVL